MKIRGSVVSLSFIFPHPPEDKKKKRQRRPALPRLAPDVAGNRNPAQPESIVTNESAAARLSGVLLYVLLHCCTAVHTG